MGTLAGELGSTAGAIGCLLQPSKGPVASSSEQRKKGCMWRIFSAPSFSGGLGDFGNLHPQGSVTANIKAAPGTSLMEQASLNPQTPSAGSSTSASASAVPFSRDDDMRTVFVGNIVAHVGNLGVLPPFRHPELVCALHAFGSRIMGNGGLLS